MEKMLKAGISHPIAVLELPDDELGIHTKVDLASSQSESGFEPGDGERGQEHFEPLEFSRLAGTFKLSERRGPSDREDEPENESDDFEIRVLSVRVGIVASATADDVPSRPVVSGRNCSRRRRRHGQAVADPASLARSGDASASRGVSPVS